MGLLDKVKSGAGQMAVKAKEVAEEGIAKAKEEAKELQLKRELGQVHDDLGRKVVELVGRGELSHADLAPGVERARQLTAEIEALNADGPDADSTATAPAEPPPSDKPPAMPT